MAESRIQLEIVTPERVVFGGEVEEVVLPGRLGEFGVLPGHTFFLSELRIGAAHFRRDGQVHWYALNQGIAEVTPQKVIVLVKTAESKDEIDVARAEAARQRAEKRLRERPEGLDVLRAEAALQRALARLKVARV
jgi:F-type H+-transporting ATPase subunit epsilon